MIRYYRGLMVLFAIFCFSCIGFTDNTTQQIPDAEFMNSIDNNNYYRDFTIAGFIVSKSTRREIEKLYGKPLSIKITNGDYGKTQFCKYRDFELTYSEMNVDGIQVPDLLTRAIFFKGPYKTARGIRIGDPEDLVVKKYGLPCRKEGMIYYNVDMLYVRFYIINQVVEKIYFEFIVD